MKKIISAFIFLMILGTNIQPILATQQSEQYCNVVEIQINIGNTQNVIVSLPNYKGAYEVTGPNKDTILFSFEEGTIIISIQDYIIKQGNPPSEFSILIESGIEELTDIKVKVDQSQGEGGGTEERNITLGNVEVFSLSEKLNFITFIGCFNQESEPEDPEVEDPEEPEVEEPEFEEPETQPEIPVQEPEEVKFESEEVKETETKDCPIVYFRTQDYRPCDAQEDEDMLPNTSDPFSAGVIFLELGGLLLLFSKKRSS